MGLLSWLRGEKRGTTPEDVQSFRKKIIERVDNSLSYANVFPEAALQMLRKAKFSLSLEIDQLPEMDYELLPAILNYGWMPVASEQTENNL